MDSRVYTPQKTIDEEEIIWGDKAEIIAGQYKSTKGKVTTIDKFGYWLSEDKPRGQFSRCYGPLQKFELRKIT